MVVLNTAGNLVPIRLRYRVKTCFPLVIGRKIQAFMALPIGTSAIRLAAFNESGNQRSSHDMCKIEFRQHGEDLFSPGKKSVSGNGTVGLKRLISRTHNKIIKDYRVSVNRKRQNDSAF